MRESHGPDPRGDLEDEVSVGGEVYRVDRDLSALLAGGLPAVLVACRHGREVIKQEQAFLVTDLDGNVHPGCRCGMGLYVSDTRFLSGWCFRIEKEWPTLLAHSSERMYLARSEFMNPALVLGDRHVPQETLHVARERAIADGVRERLRLVNFNPFPVALTLDLEFRADYADIFEVRGWQHLRQGLHLRPRIEERTLVLAYFGQDRVFRQTRIELLGGDSVQVEALPSAHGATGGHFVVSLTVPGGGGSRELDLRIDPRHAHSEIVPVQADPRPFEVFVEGLETAQQARRGDQTRITSSHALHDLVLSRANRDLLALTSGFETGPYPAAGIPWYTAPFGRDAIITALQSLVLGPELAIGTLRFLAAHQAREDDPMHDAEPGKILHEVRYGELANLGRIPQTPYYGSVDSTPLFLILLSETYRWTGDLELVRELWDAVEAALMWMEVYGDVDGDGFVEYVRRSPLGLVVQGWKDSPTSVIRPDASVPDGPIALAEVQGYVCDARRRMSELCYALDLRILGDRLAREARDMSRAFHEAFWLPDEGFYAMALDASKQPVRTPSSNPAHGLWCDVIPEAVSSRVVEHLMSPAMFSGWGIRTLAADSPVYNPMSYHNGSVWPHDNSLMAKGLADRGFKAESLRVFEALFDAACLFPYHRLPELFCGFPRGGALDRPVPYPVACSPQAWAAGTPLLLLQSVLGIVPDAPANTLRIVRPQLPPWLEEIRFQGLRIGSSRLSLQFLQVGGITTARVLERQGRIRVLIEG